MAVYKRDLVDINLETGNIHRSFLNHSIGSNDSAADHFGIRTFRDGEPVNLTGVSVQGVFFQSGHDPIAITSGNIVSGNEAEVVLPQACYNYDGQFTLAIKLVGGGVTGTIRIVDGVVDNTHASGTVAPTSTVPTYQEVLSVYEQAIAAINKTVRFDTAQTLTDTQKATARTNIDAPSTGELNDVKSAFDALYDDETTATITEAGIYTCPLYKNHVYFVSLDVTTLFGGNIYTQVASIGAVAETVGNINAIINSNGKWFTPTVDTGYIKITDTSSATGNIDVVFTDISAAINSYKRAASIARLFDVGTLYGKESFVFGMDGDLYFLPDGHAKNVTWASTTKTKVFETDKVRQLILQMQNVVQELPIDLLIETGGYYNTGGTITSHSNYQYSVVEYNGVDDVYVTTNANSIARIAVFFSGTPGAGTYIGAQDADYPASYGTLSVTDFKLTIPDGTRYIAINNIKNAGTMSAKRDTSEYASQKISEILSNLSEVDDSLYAYVNVTENLTIQSGKYYSSGGNLSSHQDYETTVISVTKDDHFKVTCAGNSLAVCILYFNGTPSNATLISYEPTSYPASYGTKVITEYEVTIPSTAKYMVVNNRPNDADLTVWKKQIAEVSETMLSYQGKNILLLGDSITQLNMTARGWPKYFSQIVKPARMDNVAVIGAHWCDYNNSTVYNGNPQPDSTEQNVVGNQVQKIINNPSDYAESYDVIIIAAGTNDPTSTGEISTSDINAQFFSGSDVLPLTSVDRSTWPGATRWITEKLRGLFPTATIIFSTPIHRIDQHDCSRVLNNGACVKRCADINGVLLCDTLHCGITMTDSSYFVDLLHPSVKGAKLIGAYIAKFFVNTFTGYLDE